MNAGNVAAFACQRPHPQLGDSVVCVRSRHHAGDHRAEHEGTLKVWPDRPAQGGYVPPLPEVHMLMPRLERIELDEPTEGVTLGYATMWAHPLVVGLLLGMLLAVWLPLVVILWRIAAY